MKRHYFLTLIALFAFHLNAQNCKAVDKPDKFFLDENLDGIDGDTNNAVFVSATDGNDANPGKKWAPVKSITMAMAYANANSKDIYIAAGTYVINAPLVLYDGVSLYGYFSSTSWNRSKLNKVIIQGPNNVLFAKGNAKNSTIAGIEFVASDAVNPSDNSVAILIDSCSGIIVFNQVIVKAGKGANGSSGQDGSDGQAGGNGGNGGNGICDGTSYGPGGFAGSSSCSSGGKGGDGGVQQANGKGGSPNSVGLIGGGGGSWGDPGGPGNKGSNGTDGADGTRGNSNLNEFAVVADGIRTNDGGDGTDGADGTGGSGGGGGGGQHCFVCADGSGNGGGGGGGAGSKGTAGKGGKGGGNSVGILALHSNVYLESCDIYTKAGGNGGNGGNGGDGGTKGTGGMGGTNCTAEVGAGGNGGNGGNGGSGGAGAGGNGGSSIALLAVQNGTNIFNYLCNFYVGSAGNGGVGGVVSSNPGLNGNMGIHGVGGPKSGNVLDSIPSVHGSLCVQDAKINRLQSGNNTGILYVYLSEPDPRQVKVTYSFANGTAINGTDYNGTAGVLTFEPYNTVQTIPFTVTKDMGDTAQKTFTFSLGTVQGDADISLGTGTVKILPYGVSAIAAPVVNNLSLAPNPASQSFNLSFNLAYSGTVNLLVYDVNGRAVMHLNGLSENGTFTAENIDVSALPAGVYTVSVVVEGLALKTLKLVKLP